MTHHPETTPFWQLLPPAPDPRRPNHAREHRWSESFVSLDDLIARLQRLAWSAQNPSTSLPGCLHAVGQAPQSLSAAERQTLLEKVQGGQATDDDRNKLRQDELRRPAELRVRLVRGPHDHTPPVPSMMHPDVQRAWARASPRSEPVSKPPVPSATVDKSTPILVEEKVVRAVISAMKRRPLVLLSGVSGSGKTQLALRLGKAWAEGWCLDDTARKVFENLKSKGLIKDHQDGWLLVHDLHDGRWNNRFGFTPVQSDWTDASHLWGYHVPLPAEAEGFYGTEALRVFLHADQEEPDKPHFLLLDEMNLSRPEHYASDLLSAMEVRGKKVIQLHRAGASVQQRGDDGTTGVTVPARISWSAHVVVIGTVNVDETTFSFAPKVLDRAALLEFVDVNLKMVFNSGKYKPNINWKTLYKDHGDWLEKLNGVLKPYNLHVAYRAAEEILLALHHAGDAEKEKDAQLCNKILPRIRGPRASTVPILMKLREEMLKQSEDEMTLRKNWQGGFSDAGGSSDSLKKIDQMLYRAFTTGFTSYFG